MKLRFWLMLCLLGTACSWLEGERGKDDWLAKEDPVAVAYLERVHQTVFADIDWTKTIDDYALREDLQWSADQCEIPETPQGPLCQRLCRDDKLGRVPIEVCYRFLSEGADSRTGGPPYRLYSVSVIPALPMSLPRQEALTSASITWHNMAYGRGTYMLGRGPQTWRWFGNETHSTVWDRGAQTVVLETFDPGRDTLLYHLIYRLPM